MKARRVCERTWVVCVVVALSAAGLRPVEARPLTSPSPAAGAPAILEDYHEHLSIGGGEISPLPAPRERFAPAAYPGRSEAGAGAGREPAGALLRASIGAPAAAAPRPGDTLWISCVYSCLRSAGVSTYSLLVCGATCGATFGIGCAICLGVGGFLLEACMILCTHLILGSKNYGSGIIEN